MLSHMAAFAAPLTSSHLSLHFDGLTVLRDKDISRIQAEFGCKMTGYIRAQTGLHIDVVQKGPSQAV